MRALERGLRQSVDRYSGCVILESVAKRLEKSFSAARPKISFPFRITVVVVHSRARTTGETMI